MKEFMELRLENTGETVLLNHEDWLIARECRWYRTGYRIENGSGTTILEYIGYGGMVNRNNNPLDVRRTELKIGEYEDGGESQFKVDSKRQTENKIWFDKRGLSYYSDDEEDAL